MKAKIVNGSDWYKDFAGHAFPVKDLPGDLLEVFVEGCTEELLALGITLSEFKPKLKKADCKVFDALGFEVKPCKYCKKMSRGGICKLCLEAAGAIRYIKSLAGGTYLLKRIVDDTDNDKSKSSN